MSAIRYQLTYSGVAFDEETYEQGDGPEFSRAAWNDIKHDQGLTYPNLPYLKDGDFALTESAAIHRYCAKKWCPELLCDDDLQAYGKAEMMWGVVCDIKALVTTRCYRGNFDRRALSEAMLPRFATIAGQLNKHQFIAGDRLCCADFSFVELVEMMDFISEGDGILFTQFPSIKRYRDRMFALPKLKEYYEEGMCRKLPFNNKVAQIGGS